MAGGCTRQETGFILEAAWNTEEYEVEDDMVENSVGILRSRTYLCPQAWIMKPFLYLELELNDLSLSFV